MTPIYVVTATIQHMYETEKYFEVEGVAFTEPGARRLVESARKRKEVLYTETEIHYAEDEQE